MPRILALFLALAATGLPAFAAETCDQALKDTTAASKTALIGPQASGHVADLLKQAEALCKGDPTQQAEGIEVLRSARAAIGE